MTDLLVETKLLRPRLRQGTVDRPRLHDLVRRGTDATVTLVSAPAGFGKTTLLTAWLSGEDRAAAWVSLDARDDAAGTFWTYVLMAVERAAPGTAAGALAALQSGRVQLETALAQLVNELSVLPDDLTIVLDDYHLIDSAEVQTGMAFLIDHLPAHVHVVISTRADPALPLARLRARGELVEVRAADLRFTSEEAAAFLNDASGLSLTEDDVTALGARTEGWAAALQLAALSLQSHDDPARFIAGFAGDDRFVVDYLADEVLDAQPEEVRRFLLDTSILDRLTGPLCDTVVGAGVDGPGRHANGSSVLETLERQNLFVVPLDDHRRWYRYHHLFGDVLRAHLVAERPDDVAGLHRRASRWYADAGDTESAVRHALAAGDTAAAADQVELAIPDLRRARREDVIRRWADELPADVLNDRPVLAIGFVGALMASNEFDSVQRRLRDIEHQMRRPESELVVVDRAELARLPAAVETYRAGIALVGGDPAGAIEAARRAAAAAAAGDDLTRSAASALMGLAYWTTGDVVAAHDGYAAAAAGLTRAGHIADVLGCSLTLADMELALGRLRDAQRTLDDALELSRRHTPAGGGVMRGTADMLVAQSRAAWHRNDLDLAAELLRRANELGEAAGLPQNPYRWRVAMARLRVTERDWEGARDLLDEAERVYVGDFSPPVHPVHATRARVLAASGDIAGAHAWARQHGITAEDDLDYLHEYEHVTLARVLLAEHRIGGRPEPLQAAVGLLDRLLAAAEAGGRAGTTIEVETLRARALLAGADRDGAGQALEHAIDLAEPEGWVRFFLDAGPTMVELLHVVAATRPDSSFVRTLLDLAAGTSETQAEAGPSAASGRPLSAANDALVEPLSDRELEVLRLLASDLDGPGIARQLVVSLNTVRTHTKHIYAKLGANNRRSAVSTAHQLGLLTRTAR